MMRVFTTAALLSVAFAGATFAQQKEGMVTVNVSDIEAVSGNTVQIPLGIATQVCPNLDVNALTAEQRGGITAIDCTVTNSTATEAFTNYVTRGPMNSQGPDDNQGQGTESAPGQQKKSQ